MKGEKSFSVGQVVEVQCPHCNQMAILVAGNAVKYKFGHAVNNTKKICTTNFVYSDVCNKCGKTLKVKAHVRVECDKE